MILVDPLDHKVVLRKIYAHVPSGVLTLAASTMGQPVGMVVSSFSTVSLAPPLIAVNIRNESTTWPNLADADRIGVSLLAEEHFDIGRQLAQAHAGGRFESVSHTVDDGGAVFINGAVLWMETVVEKAVPAGDHIVVLLKLTRVAEEPAASPLLFHRSTFKGIVQ